MKLTAERAGQIAQRIALAPKTPSGRFKRGHKALLAKELGISELTVKRIAALAR